MILVSGGVGVMGSRLVKGLVKAGNKVRVLTLPNDPNVSRLDGYDCEIIYGDVSDLNTLKGIFDDVKTVYHLAAIIITNDPAVYKKINVEGTRNMVEGAVAGGVEHFIYVSSAAMSFSPASDYARSKSEGEHIIKSQKSMRYTIVRPTLVYEKNGGQEFIMFLDYLKKYPIIPFIGRGRAKKNPIYVDDLVHGMLAIANNSKTYSKIYNFCGGEEISIWDLAKLILKHQGLSKKMIPIPIPVCKLVAFIMERTMNNPPLSRYAISRIVQDANLDNTSARIDLGFDPIGISGGLQICFPLAFG
ncbi:NAD-dependent epimerase/dehydratase family protein [Acidobacteriota bacterium]